MGWPSGLRVRTLSFGAAWSSWVSLCPPFRCLVFLIVGISDFGSLFRVGRFLDLGSGFGLFVLGRRLLYRLRLAAWFILD